jgi:hypothetical protein
MSIAKMKKEISDQLSKEFGEFAELKATTSSMASIIKNDLSFVLEKQRNKKNNIDCERQCLGIVQYLQEGIIPTGSPPNTLHVRPFTILFDTENLPFKNKKIEAEIGDTGEIGGYAKENIFPIEANYENIDSILKIEASKEKTGFWHGLIHLFCNNSVEGHVLYVFASSSEVLYVDNQWSKSCNNENYPFFDSLKWSHYDFEDRFSHNLWALKIDNWVKCWGEATSIHYKIFEYDLYKQKRHFSVLGSTPTLNFNQLAKPKKLKEDKPIISPMDLERLAGIYHNSRMGVSSSLYSISENKGTDEQRKKNIGQKRKLDSLSNGTIFDSRQVSKKLSTEKAVSPR